MQLQPGNTLFDAFMGNMLFALQQSELSRLGNKNRGFRVGTGVKESMLL